MNKILQSKYWLYSQLSFIIIILIIFFILPNPNSLPKVEVPTTSGIVIDKYEYNYKYYLVIKEKDGSKKEILSNKKDFENYKINESLVLTNKVLDFQGKEMLYKALHFLLIFFIFTLFFTCIVIPK